MFEYVSPKLFARLSKGKKVKDFPNPDVKEIDGVSYYIVDNPTCMIRKLEENEYPWHLGLSHDTFTEKYGSEDAYILKVSTGFSPTDLVAGVKKGMYTEDTPLSRKTGWLSSCNLGTASDAFCGSKVNNAIKILRSKGFMFDFI